MGPRITQFRRHSTGQSVCMGTANRSLHLNRNWAFAWDLLFVNALLADNRVHQRNMTISCEIQLEQPVIYCAQCTCRWRTCGLYPCVERTEVQHTIWIGVWTRPPPKGRCIQVYPDPEFGCQCSDEVFSKTRIVYLNICMNSPCINHKFLVHEFGSRNISWQPRHAQVHNNK